MTVFFSFHFFFNIPCLEKGRNIQKNTWLMLEPLSIATTGCCKSINKPGAKQHQGRKVRHDLRCSQYVIRQFFLFFETCHTCDLNGQQFLTYLGSSNEIALMVPKFKFKTVLHTFLIQFELRLYYQPCGIQVINICNHYHVF